jgi:tetratricopeptide (TPR) repeat protein
MEVEYEGEERCVEAVWHTRQIDDKDQLYKKLCNLSLLPHLLAPQFVNTFMDYCRYVGDGSYARVLDGYEKNLKQSQRMWLNKRLLAGFARTVGSYSKAALFLEDCLSEVAVNTSFEDAAMAHVELAELYARYNVHPSSGGHQAVEALRLIAVAESLLRRLGSLQVTGVDVRMIQAMKEQGGQLTRHQKVLSTLALCKHVQALVLLLYRSRWGNKRDEEIVIDAREALLLREELSDWAAAGETLNLLGSLSMKRNNFGDAEQYFIKSLQYRERVLSRYDPDLGQVHTSLGTLYLEMHQYELCIQNFRKAKDIYTAALGVDHPRGCHALEGLSMAYHAKGHSPKARMLMSDVVRIRRSKLGEQHPMHLKSKALLEKYQDSKAVQVTSRTPARDSKDAVHTQKRIICPFICSTFQDMKLEREHLTAAVYPVFSYECSKRRVRYNAHDFRWGITEEECNNGKVIQRCLNEIDVTYPYFICILGHRYGWCHPKEGPKDQLLQKQFEVASEYYPWLKEEQYQEKSITELEIENRFFRNMDKPNFQHGALFYFREKSIDKFTDEDPYHQEKMAKLKARILEAGVTPRTYKDEKVLGSMVKADLLMLLDHDYPAQENYTELDEENDAHSSYGYSLTSFFIAEDKFLPLISTHLDGSGGPMIITGEGGSGKSTLMAYFLADSDYNRQHFGECMCIIHHFGTSQKSSVHYLAIWRFISIWKQEFDLERKVPAEDQPQQLIDTFPEWIRMASEEAKKRGQKLVLSLDSVEMLFNIGGAHSLEWLPTDFPDNFYLFVTVRQNSQLYSTLKDRHWAVQYMEPLLPDEREEFVSQYLTGQYGKKLKQSQIENIVACSMSGNPLFLSNVCEHLQQFGDFYKVDAKLEQLLACTSLTELYEVLLSDMEEDFKADIDKFQDILCAICVSRGGMSPTSLNKFVGTGEGAISPDVFEQIMSNVRRWLKDEHGLVTFLQPALKTMIRERYLPSDEHVRQLHLKVRFVVLWYCGTVVYSLRCGCVYSYTYIRIYMCVCLFLGSFKFVPVCVSMF